MGLQGHSNSFGQKSGLKLMKSSIKPHVFIVLGLVFATIFLSGCSRVSKPVATVVVHPTENQKPVFTSTPTEPVRPTNTVTIATNRAPAFTPSPVPTWGPLPTVAKDKLSKTIHDYFIKNGGCNLPCWWGMEPGVTAWGSAVQRFDTLDAQPSSWVEQTVLGNSALPEYYRGYEFTDNTTTISWLISGINEKISTITIATDNKEQFGFSPILKNMGPPDQIYLTTFQYTPGYPDFEPFLPFSVIFNYQNKHMVIWYQMQGQKEGANIIACNKDYQIYVWIWAKELVGENHENYVLNMAGGGYEGFRNLRVLEEATTINKEQFTKIFQNTEDRCISTPAEMW